MLIVLSHAGARVCLRRCGPPGLRGRPGALDFLIHQQAAEGDLRGCNLELMLAFTVHKRGLCPHCGYPREVCRNEERFEAQKEFCYAKAAIDHAEAQKAPGGRESGLLHEPAYQPPIEI